MSGDTPVNELSFRIHHTMLPVADLDRSIGFYTRLLGMKAMGRRTDETRKVEVGHVGYGDRDSQPSFELTQDIGESAPAEVVPTGIHVGIHVNDLQRLCDVLESERVKFLQPLKGTPGKRLTAWIRDPDGHALELVEVHAG
ncbi:MAG TPA: VOC family protein [Candidatus Binataceae bacterium]|nr:VOC family protein [Candidatus Binataceae bacterium]